MHIGHNDDFCAIGKPMHCRNNAPVLFSIAVMTALFMLSCGRTGTPPPADGTLPRISMTAPANGSTNVPVNLSSGIVITFSEKMDPSTINAQTITLGEGQNNIAGAVRYGEVGGVPNAVFVPSSSLKTTTLYRLDIAAAVTDIYGNAMEAPYIGSFFTESGPDTAAPAVEFTVPAQGAISVVPTTALAVIFDEPVIPATIVFTLATGSTTIPCGRSYGGTTAIFTPSTVLTANTLYTATVYSGALDLAGNTMPGDHVWSFTTQ